MAFVLGLAFILFLVGKFSLGLGGGWPTVILVFIPGEDMAALVLTVVTIHHKPSIKHV